MVVAAQFNYISIMVPVSIPPGIFKHFNQLIRDFLWNGKKPRINILKLYTSRNLGGLGLPNAELYGISFESRWCNFLRKMLELKAVSCCC